MTLRASSRSMRCWGVALIALSLHFALGGGQKRRLGRGPAARSCQAHPQPDGILGEALARSWRWQKLLDHGVYVSISEISESERMNNSPTLADPAARSAGAPIRTCIRRGPATAQVTSGQS
jgi:hypothetical protein